MCCRQGLLTADEAAFAEEGVSSLCEALRPDVIALTDAFDFPDRVLNSALGKEDGNGSGWGFLAPDLGAVEVAVTTVDETIETLALPTVDFIKIDVEGSEMAVLLGAENALSEFKPILIFEVNTFCLWRYGRTFPQDLIQWVRDRYPFTAAIFSDGSVTEIVDDATVNHLLHLVGSRGGLLDIVASPKPFIQKLENINP